ncbi:glycosyltransferase family 4 protein [Aquibacillus sediminis]|uniref:glycosyltransferase family 4 protein n=1 Tax=Aquibacillus sediminis TaxID=2574734 RepID=UPI00110813FE|nr:MraY family glycosyltransferase [Aquibacillus sediminis]
MFSTTELLIAFFISFITTLLLVYPVRKIAIKLGIMDAPDYRKIHKVVTPRLGGLAIFLGALTGAIYLGPNHDYLLEITIGAIVIVVTGLLDDKYQLRPVVKLLGQLLAAGCLLYGGLIIERINVPLLGLVELNTTVSILITTLWIIGIANAINLIDGLDGLASGISAIALTSILIMAIADQRVVVIYLCVILIGSNIGFLFHNFHPAKIYMGDTGSMFLGYMIAVISILGLFKNVTLFSFVIPVIVLAIPIFDTLFSIIRRANKGTGIMMPDKQHLHHQLLAAGLSHRNTVLLLYGFSMTFGVLAILFSGASIGLSLIITLIVLFLLQMFAEFVGIVGKGKMPVLRYSKRLIKKVTNRSTQS